MIWHYTLTDRQGAIQVGKVSGSTRSAAATAAAARYNVPARKVTSLVKMAKR